MTAVFNVRGTDRGRPLADLTHRLGYAELIPEAQEVLDRLVPKEREVEAEDGRHFLVRILPYRTTDDRIDGIVITFIDISALKQSQAELHDLNRTLEQRIADRTSRLRESERRFEALVNASSQIVWTMDAQGKAVEDSPSWREFTGQKLEEWLGSGWLDAVHPEERKAVEREWRAAVRSHTPVDMEMRLRHHKQEWCWTRVRAVPLYDDDGQVTGWVGMNTDIDSTKKAQRQLNETRARLTLVEQQERRRIAGILHDDLQQRLFAIQLKLTSARNAVVRGETSERVGQLFQEAHGWIDDAIAITRRLSVDLSPPILHGDSLEEALVWLQAHMRELHGLEVELDVDAGLPLPSVELRVLLFHITRELLFNVVKHANVERSRVTLSASDGAIHIEVSDEGAGFDPAALSTAISSDAGIGLFSIRDRLQLLGGELSVESKRGKGTVIDVTLPLGLVAAASEPQLR